MMNQTGREILRHEVPSWVDPEGAEYFITICCRELGVNQLCVPRVGEELLASARFYRGQEKWFPSVFLLMPDHVHMLVRFGRESSSIVGVVSAWKRYTARNLGITWQQGFFEHRLRADENAGEKAAYILQNPVRAGLVRDPGEWPFLLLLRD